MQFTGLSVDHFGIFEEFPLADLGPGLTVVYGGNGSGKTTLVHFIRSVLFGFDAASVSNGFRSPRNSGQLDTDLRGQRIRFRRRARPGEVDDVEVIDRASGAEFETPGSQLPGWVSEDVFREVFSVGHEEAERFELLTQLCLNGPAGSGDGTIEAEIRRAETALAQAVAERTGDGLRDGLTQRLDELTQRRTTLSQRLTELRQVPPHVPARIAEIERRLTELNNSASMLTQQIDALREQLHQLDERRTRLLQQNTLPLDRDRIQTEIDRLSERLEQWSEIRSAIEQQTPAPADAVSKSHMQDSVRSVRALVSRLEHRLDDLQSAEPSLQKTRQHLRDEVFGLCDYLARHESALAAAEQNLETLFASRALQNITLLSDQLSQRQDCLRDELSRADNILAAEDRLSRSTRCQLQAHQDFRSGSGSGSTDTASLQDLDSRLDQLRGQLQDLDRQRQQLTDQQPPLQQELEELRRQLSGCARLEDIDRLNADIAEVDANSDLLKSRVSVLERTEASLRQVIARLHSQRQPAVLEQASQWLQRLTENDCTGFGLTDDRSGLVVQTRRSQTAIPVSQLSHGTRDQAALALRLALIQQQAEHQDRVPLILDDVFITADDDRAEAAADLLMELSQAGQQILLLTSQNDVREVFARREATIRTLQDRSLPEPQPAPEAEPPAAEPAAVDQSLVFKAFDGEAEECPGEMGERVASGTTEAGAKWLFYLEVDNPVDDLAGLTVAEIAALQSVDIQTVDELLQAEAQEVEDKFRGHGFLIDADRVRAWQGQAEMSCRVPMLRRRDAALLYAAGIRSVEQLSRLRPEAVFDLLTRFQHSEAGAHYLRAGRSIDRQQAINWTRWALHARSMKDARRHSNEFHTRSRTAAAASGTAASGRAARSQRSGSGDPAVRRQRRPRLSGDSRRSRSDRFSRRRRRMERKAELQRDPAEKETSARRVPRVHRVDDRDSGKRADNGNGSADNSRQTDGGLKFYLSRQSPIEEAPSIGPKTADRLVRVQISTVDDLLNASPDQLSAMLNHRRITSEVVEQWQAQAALVCQIPQLRGHDAQILVACGYAEAEEVAALQPSELFAEVAPFCDTAEGERIVRNGRKPDLDEVTDWINWAQNSRSLKAA